MQYDQYKFLVSEIEDLKKKNAGLERENGELRTQSPRAIKNVSTRTSSDESTIHKIKELESKLGFAEKENEEFRKKFAKFQGTELKSDVLINENEKLEHQLAERIKEIDMLRKEKMELTNKIKSSVAERNREIEDLNERLKELEPYPQILSDAESYFQGQISDLTSQVEHLSLTVKGREKEIEILRKSIKQMDKDICIDPVEHDQLQQKSKEIEILKSELTSLRSKAVSLNEEFNSLIASSKAKDKEIENLRRVIQQTSLESKKEINLEHHHETRLEKEVERLSKLLDEKQKEVEEMRKRTTDSSVRLHAMHSLETENQKLSSKNKELEDINKGFKKNLDYMAKSVHKQNEQLHLKEQEILDLQLDKGELNSEIKLLKQELKEVSKRNTQDKDFLIGELQEMNTKLTKEIDILVQNANHHAQERQKLIFEKESIMKLISDRDDQISSLIEKTEKLQAEIDRLTSRLNQVVPKAKSLEEEDKHLTEQLKKEQEENRVFRIRITELERFRAGFDDLKKQLEEITEERDKFAKTHEKADGQRTFFEEKLSKLESDLQAKKIEINDLLHQNKLLRSDITMLERKLTESNSTIEHLTNKVNEVNSANQPDLTPHKEELFEELKQLDHENLFVSQERDYLLKTLEERNDQIIEHEEAEKKLKLELQQATSRILALEQELKNLGNLLTTKQKENWDLENGIAELGRTKTELGVMQKLLSNMKQEKVELSKVIEERDKHIADLKLKVSQISREVVLERDSISSETAPLKAEIGRLKQELELSRIESNKLIDKTMQEKDKQVKVVEDRDRHIADLKLKVSQISSEVSLERNMIRSQTGPLQGEIGRLKQELELSGIESNKLVDKTMQEKNQLVKLLEDRDRQIADLKLKVSQISSEVSLDRNMIRSETEPLKAEILHLRLEVEKHNLDRDNFNQLIAQKDRQINALSVDFARLIHDNKEFIKIIEDLEKKHDSVLLTLQQREAEMKKFEGLVDKTFPELQTLKDTAQAQSMEVNRLHRLNSEQERELVDLRGKVQRVVELEKTVQDLSMQNRQLRERIRSYGQAKADLSEMQNNVDDLIEKRDKLLGIISVKDNELKKIKPVLSENEALKSQLHGSTLTQEELMTENEQLLRDNRYLRQTCQDLQRGFGQLNDKYRVLEDVYLEMKGSFPPREQVIWKFEEPYEQKNQFDQRFQGKNIQESTKMTSQSVSKNIDQPPQRF